MGVRSCGAPVEAKVVTLSTSSASAALPAGSSYRIVADVACWVEFGDSGVTAASATAPAMYLAAGVELLIGKPGTGAATGQAEPTHIAAIAGGAGNLSIVGLA